MDNQNENLMGFEKRLGRILNDSAKVSEILGLIPENVLLPLFYKGDVVRLREGGEITITEVGFKRGEYIYFFEDENGDEWYEREENMVYEEL